jgi:ribonuclease HIII
MKLYRLQLDPAQIKHLHTFLNQKGFVIGNLAHAHFQARHPGGGLTISCYLSGKCLIQGKGTEEFVTDTLEPQILKTYRFQEAEAYEEKIGMDEAGKGDFFGPLSIAAVFLPQASYIPLKQAGVGDSKNIADTRIGDLAKLIRENTRWHTLVFNPEKYNPLYNRFQNLNRLLAWGHCTCLKELLQTCSAKKALLDQFGNKETALYYHKQLKLDVILEQRTHAEEDLAVAAASILARENFLKHLEALGRENHITLPKGAGAPVIKALHKIREEKGLGVFPKIAKMHFKTSGLLYEND